MGASSSLASEPFETLKNQLQKVQMTYRRVRGAIDELEGALKALKVWSVEAPGADASQLLQEMQSCTCRQLLRNDCIFFRLLLKENVKKSQWAKVVGGRLKPCGHTCQILNKDLNCK